MEYPTIIDAIRAIKSDIAVTIRGTDITWDDGNPTNITQKQIDELKSTILLRSPFVLYEIILTIFNI